MNLCLFCGCWCFHFFFSFYFIYAHLSEATVNIIWLKLIRSGWFETLTCTQARSGQSECKWWNLSDFIGVSSWKLRVWYGELQENLYLAIYMKQKLEKSKFANSTPTRLKTQSPPVEINSRSSMIVIIYGKKVSWLYLFWTTTKIKHSDLFSY